jgi:nitroimidazol reductase NimA-like FMN-containing flavoprotein (pyridoxamine 5'-phosphate oxidase superfamily)
VKRSPERASYDPGSVHAVLDAASVGHVGFAVDGQPVVIPMLYGREGSAVYLHGSVASRLMRTLPKVPTACLSVTLLDALVLARSAFHHSMNYRSVVAFGPVHTLTDDDEKLHGLRVITEHLVPGRWDEVREPSRPELRQTAVLRLDIAEASAKARTHGVVDDEEDHALDVWAGLLPVVHRFGEPVPDPALAAGTPLSPSIAAFLAAG